MKFYEITITPTSPFGTVPKGDTLFGHFCWQAAHDPGLLEGGLETQLKRHGDSPFAVFSSAFPKIENGNMQYFFPRPEAATLDRNLDTAKTRKQRLLDGKALKKKQWMALDRLDVIEPAKVEFLSGEELSMRVVNERPSTATASPVAGGAEDVVFTLSQPHNTIDRLTCTTGTGQFAPYAKENQYYLPGITLAIFVLLDETCTDIERIHKGLEKIGRWGFGRDASTGMGRFTVNAHAEIALPRLDNANACFTLAPCVLQQRTFRHAFFTPFVRFGKHGDRLATGKAPFKRPVVMADEGAVLVPDAPADYTAAFIGACVSGVSYADPEAVAQGYAPWLPIKMEL